MRLVANIELMGYPNAPAVFRSAPLRKLLRLSPLEEPTLLIKNMALEVHGGEVVSIVGPSGAGKTTLLRILAGLETRGKGSVCLNGMRVEKPSRKIQVVFQEHRLLPWLSVESNLRFAASREERGDGNATALDLLRAVGLEGRRHALPKDMSGGELVRAAFVRALTCEPELLLLDEPFSALDQVTKETVQDIFLAVLQKRELKDTAVLIVSHSISDAVFLSDRVIVVRRNPLSVYRGFSMPATRARRDPGLADVEGRVLTALREVEGLNDCG